VNLPLSFNETLRHVAGLFLPRRCAACDQALMSFEQAICLQCTSELPQTHFHDDALNAVERLFHGKQNLHAASALLRFNASGMVQRMLHRLKYRGDMEVGLELGRRMAQAAMSSRRFADVDVLVAVPLHPRKERQRGYNQSQVLVDGMREVWPTRTSGAGLLRVTSTKSQTKRGRVERWKNVEHAFDIGDQATLEHAHVLLVDDVITTGATIEACATALSSVPGIRISVFTCAYA
jgi:ComF family protein